MPENFEGRRESEEENISIPIDEIESLEHSREEFIDFEKESQEVIERMKIERELRTISRDLAHPIIDSVLRNKKLRPFLEIKDEEEKDLREAIKHREFEDMDFNPKPISAEAKKLYDRVTKRIMSCCWFDPHFAVADREKSNTFYLCIEAGGMLTVKEREDHFYVLHEIPKDTNESQRKDITERISMLQESSYFPAVELTENAIEVEYVPSRENAKEGEDISDFYDFCHKIGFGADTNATNFLRYKGQLKYTDKDLIEWLIDPKKEPVNRKKSVLTKKVW